MSKPVDEIAYWPLALPVAIFFWVMLGPVCDLLGLYDDYAAARDRRRKV